MQAAAHRALDGRPERNLRPNARARQINRRQHIAGRTFQHHSAQPHPRNLRREDHVHRADLPGRIGCPRRAGSAASLGKVLVRSSLGEHLDLIQCPRHGDVHRHRLRRGRGEHIFAGADVYRRGHHRLGGRRARQSAETGRIGITPRRSQRVGREVEGRHPVCSRRRVRRGIAVRSRHRQRDGVRGCGHHVAARIFLGHRDRAARIPTRLKVRRRRRAEGQLRRNRFHRLCGRRAGHAAVAGRIGIAPRRCQRGRGQIERRHATRSRGRVCCRIACWPSHRQRDGVPGCGHQFPARVVFCDRDRSRVPARLKDGRGRRAERQLRHHIKPRAAEHDRLGGVCHIQCVVRKRHVARVEAHGSRHKVRRNVAGAPFGKRIDRGAEIRVASVLGEVRRIARIACERQRFVPDVCDRYRQRPICRVQLPRQGRGRKRQRRRIGLIHLQHASEIGIADVDIAAAVHRQASEIQQTAGQRGLRAVAAARPRLHYNSIVAGIGDIDVAVAVHRHANRSNQPAAHRGLRAVAAAGPRHLDYAIVLPIRYIDIAIAVNCHTLGIRQPAAHRRYRAVAAACPR